MNFGKASVLLVIATWVYGLFPLISGSYAFYWWGKYAIYLPISGVSLGLISFIKKETPVIYSVIGMFLNGIVFWYII
jgi:hypothetical protein